MRCDCMCRGNVRASSTVSARKVGCARTNCQQVPLDRTNGRRCLFYFYFDKGFFRFEFDRTETRTHCFRDANNEGCTLHTMSVSRAMPHSQ